MKTKEAAWTYVNEITHCKLDKRSGNETVYAEFDDVESAFIAGAEWQKKQDGWKPISELPEDYREPILLRNLTLYCQYQVSYYDDDKHDGAYIDIDRYTDFKYID